MDIEGLVLKAKVHAANVTDRDGIKTLLEQGQGLFSRLTHLWLDAGYKGKSKEWVKNVLGWTVEIVQHSPKVAPAEVMRVWAREGVVIDWKKLLPPRGFKALPRRWVVERTLSRLGQNRKMSKYYQRFCSTGEAFIYVAMSRLMVRRLARS